METRYSEDLRTPPPNPSHFLSISVFFETENVICCIKCTYFGRWILFCRILVQKHSFGPRIRNFERLGHMPSYDFRGHPHSLSDLVGGPGTPPESTLGFHLWLDLWIFYFAGCHCWLHAAHSSNGSSSHPTLYQWNWNPVLECRWIISHPRIWEGSEGSQGTFPSWQRRSEPF